MSVPPSPMRSETFASTIVVVVPARSNAKSPESDCPAIASVTPVPLTRMARLPSTVE